MADPYHIDLEQFSLERFQGILETAKLSPGRRVLQEDLPERFAALESAGICDLADLVAALKTRPRMEKFAEKSGLPLDYLTILRREANSYLPKPVRLRDIPGVDQAQIEKLAGAGITHSKHLFGRGLAHDDRVELAAQADISVEEVHELVKMADLARVYGVGPVFIRMLYDAGVKTVEQLVASNPAELLEQLHAINAGQKYTEIMPILKEMAFVIDFAKMLPIAIED